MARQALPPTREPGPSFFSESKREPRGVCRLPGLSPSPCRQQFTVPNTRSIPLALQMREGIILVNLSGRGDKDVDTAARWFGLVTGEK